MMSQSQTFQEKDTEEVVEEADDGISEEDTEEA